MDTICLACGCRYGNHNDDDCPRCKLVGCFTDSPAPKITDPHAEIEFLKARLGRLEKYILERE
jgi:hypothetical protein